jgi:hypothetical protein
MLLIENNIIHSMTSSEHHGDCMQIMGFEGTAIVRNNIVWDCTQDIYFDDYSPVPGTAPRGDVYIYNNVVYNTQFKSLEYPGFYNGIAVGPRYNNWRSLTIYSNTLVDLNDGTGGIGGGAVSSNGYQIGVVRIFNNLFYNSINGFGVVGNISRDYNMYYNEHRDWYLAGWVNLEDFQRRYPTLEQHSFYAKALFKNYSYPYPDFHSVAQSPSINSGTSLSAINGIYFNFDYDRTQRPQDSGWDIGAYEYISSDTTPPAAPRNVMII